MPSRSRDVRGSLLAATLALSLVMPGAGCTEEWTKGARLNWETGEGKSYLIPALEVGGFLVGLNAFNRAFIDSDTYGSDGHTIWRNLRTALVFGDLFKAVFPSRNPEIFIRLRLGVTLSTESANAGLSPRVHQQEGSLDYHMIYGLPGKPGYQYKRPFDFFLFEFTAVPNVSSAVNAIENFTVRGLLAGAKYELGDDFGGVWGGFGGDEDC